jgi:hypothetical protein
MIIRMFSMTICVCQTKQYMTRFVGKYQICNNQEKEFMLKRIVSLIFEYSRATYILVVFPLSPVIDPLNYYLHFAGAKIGPRSGICFL